MIKKIISYLGGQAILKLSMLLIGLTLVRVLNVSDYALYSLMTGLLGVAAVLSNSAVSTAFITLVSRKEEKLGDYFYSAINLRQLFFLVSSLLVITMALFSYNKIWGKSLYGICLSIVLITNYITLYSLIFQSYLFTKENTRVLNKTVITSCVTRLILILLLSLIWRNVAGVLAINLAGYIIEFFLLKKNTNLFLLPQPTNENLVSGKKEIINFITPIVPNTIYFAFRPQVSIFLLAFYGATYSLASLGALSRISLIISSLSVIFPFYVQPQLAKCKTRKEFIFHLFVILGAFFLITLILALSVLLYPKLWLLLLGSKYSGLGEDVVYAVITPCITLFVGIFFTAIMAIGNNKSLYFESILSLIFQIVFLSLYANHFTLNKALIMSILSEILSMSFYAVMLTMKLKNPNINEINWNQNV